MVGDQNDHQPLLSKNRVYVRHGTYGLYMRFNPHFLSHNRIYVRHGTYGLYMRFNPHFLSHNRVYVRHGTYGLYMRFNPHFLSHNRIYIRRGTHGSCAFCPRELSPHLLSHNRVYIRVAAIKCYYQPMRQAHYRRRCPACPALTHTCLVRAVCL